MHGQYLSVFGEYGKFGIICGIQNCHHTQGKYLNIFREYVERTYVCLEKTQRDSGRNLQETQN
jgi:hypothetical protein